MVLRKTHLYAALALIAALPIAAFNMATEAINRAWDWMVDAFKPEPLRLVDGYDAPLLVDPGEPFDPGLLQSLRHEAGVSRQAAARHC
ncbi:MAG: hypothetical protein Tp170SUR191951_5 [Prokaryotic dsDNA virus sp.]|nr:hypothetical protein [Pseudomonas sp.]MBS67312.1 hypothetical protein [Pseudomonas sp.]QDP55167.1 MAG: hypothetical protein Tp170SUR191951_5 [Prokaryotic dsDNA virus sp.]|tara:strand:- start:5826 stop:6089 length:264 start_codon:yes stop_codon:yes gene_type:complete